MRVLSVGNMYPPHHYGGYELVWHSAVEHLRSGGHDVRVLTTDTRTGARVADPPHVYRDLRWHLREGRFESLGIRAVVAMARHNHRALQWQLDDFRPDVVAWWSMGGLTLTMLEAVRRSGLPAVAFVHDEWLDYGRRFDPWLRLFLGPRRSRLAPLAERLARMPASVDFAGAGAYLFVSEFTRRHALGLGLGLRHTGVAHSGIDPDFLDPAPPREWGWRLLYVGRLDRRKGVDTAIEALLHLPTEAQLTIIGGWDKQAEQQFAELAARFGLGGRVVFAGQCERDELMAAYEAADAVVFPVTWDEPWGLVPLEAMGRGRPVVATGRGGSGEYLRDGENCLLFEAGNPAALATAIRRLGADPALRLRLRDGGLQTAPMHTEAALNETVERALLEASGAPANPAAARTPEGCR